MHELVMPTTAEASGGEKILRQVQDDKALKPRRVMPTVAEASGAGKILRQAQDDGDAQDDR